MEKTKISQTDFISSFQVAVNVEPLIEIMMNGNRKNMVSEQDQTVNYHFPLDAPQFAAYRSFTPQSIACALRIRLWTPVLVRKHKEEITKSGEKRGEILEIILILPALVKEEAEKPSSSSPSSSNSE